MKVAIEKIILFIVVSVLAYVLCIRLNQAIINNHNNEVSFEIYSYVLSLLLTLGFSIQALLDSSEQKNEIKHQREKLQKVTSHLEEISKSLPTAYIGKFPKHLTEIRKLVEQAHKDFSIMVDCVDYGSFSAPPLHEELLKSIMDARGKNVNVQILLCGDEQHISRSSPFFGKDYLTLLNETAFVECLNAYLNFHPTFERPTNDSEFKKMLQDYQDSVWNKLKAAGVDKRYLQLKGNSTNPENYPGIFFWMEDDENAVFLLSHTGVEAQEIAFRTRDARLITEIFKKTFAENWKLAKAEKSNAPRPAP